MTKGCVPTSARRRIVIRTLNKVYHRVGHTRRRIEKKTTSQSSAKAPSYTVGAVGLSISLLPVNNRNNPEGEINKQGKQHVTPVNKGK